MCFLSSIEMVGVTLSYPVVMGIEMTLGDVSALPAGPRRPERRTAQGRCCACSAPWPSTPWRSSGSRTTGQGRAAGGGRPARSASVEARPVAGQVAVAPEGDDDELDYVFDSTGGDDACVPIERLVDALSPTKTKGQGGTTSRRVSVEGSVAPSPPACC